METNTPNNQNPEETEKVSREENSEQLNEKAEQEIKPEAKKKNSAKAKKTSKPAGKPAKKKEIVKDDPSAPSEAPEEKPVEGEPLATAEEQEPAQLKKDDAEVENAAIEPEAVEEAPLKPVALEDEAAEPEAVEEKLVVVDEEKGAESILESIDELEDDQDEEGDEEEHEEPEEDLQVNYHELGLEELVALLEEIVKEDDISSMRKKAALIKVAFLKKHTSSQEEKLASIADSEEEEDHGEEEKDDLEQRFDAAFQVYSDKRKAFLEKQEEEKQQNLETKKLILEELKALIESEESLKKTYDDFKILQDKWKAVGLVPKSEVNNLWQNYHFYVEKFFDKVKINKELRDLDLKKNMELKMELCEKAEELLLETSILKSFKQLQQYHKQWKEIGPVPQDKKDEIWERFRSTTEKINQARRDHYNKLKEEQEGNLVSKTALCVKAEEVVQRENKSLKDWQENTREISELLKVWKTIGPAPRKENDEIWDRFKTSMDTFFAGKKEFLQVIKEEQLNNYNLKLDLCAQAEAIKGSTDWKETTRDLINLQKEWKSIGPVPRKHSDKIWQRFRSACDEFFNSKSEYFANRKTHETDNLKSKEDLIQKVESHKFGKDKNENLEIIKGFQREWTEIGHVPFKDKDRLQNSFRNAINNKLDQLKISKAEIQTIGYKQRFENIRENPNADRIVRNERYFLVQKVKKLEEEIQLLENNMGFLAKSKKADLLKEEFMKKIDNARIEVDVLKEKIKFLERETE